jgi:bifunctional UDP-N-acetylglucosamine pyrophosphorylase/glucosamine-1-phosphate N-acetyltransferase
MAKPGQAVVVLAAGKGTRMRSRVPKVLHRLAGRCLLDHVLDLALARSAADQVVVVVGHQAESVITHVAPRRVRTALQEPQLGTGDALRVGLEALSSDEALAPETVLVLSGDVPLLRPATVDRLEAGLDAATDAVLLTAALDQPGSYGRVLRRAATAPEPACDMVEADVVEAIVEVQDADEATLAVREVNAGVYVFRHGPLVEAMADLRPDNAQGEYYLTDLVEALGRRGRVVRAREVEDSEEMLGVNTRQDLAHLGRLLNRRIAGGLLEAGVTIVDPGSTWVELGCQVEADVVLEPGVVLKRGARVRAGAVVGAGSVIDGAEVAAGAQVPPLTLLTA